MSKQAANLKSAPKAGKLDRVAAREAAKGTQVPPKAKATPAKARQSKARDPQTAKATPPATPVQGTVAAGTKASVDRSQKHTYPSATDVLVLVTPVPAGLGSDQRRRLEYVTKAEGEAKKGKVAFTGGYIAEHCPDGRRTLRRAWRAGVLAYAAK